MRPRSFECLIFHIFRNNTPLLPLKIPKDLDGKPLNVGVVVISPYICDRVGGGYFGLDIEIIEAMASVLNFTVRYLRSDELEKPNDSLGIPWKGTVGPWKSVLLRVLSRDVDIAIGNFVLRPERIADFGYTPPYTRDVVRFFVTSDPILSRTTDKVEAIILRVVAVHIFISLMMYLLKDSTGQRRGDLGATALMVSIL